MRSSELVAIIEASNDLEALRAAIAPAMPAFRRGLAERGRSAPILIGTEGKTITIQEEHVAQVCREYLEGHLDASEFAYVMTALELCPDFVMASEGVAAAVSVLSESPVADPTLRTRVGTILHSLQSTAH